MPFKRIVKMTFRPEEIDNFLEVFHQSSAHIRAFPGCLHLELWRGKRQENVLFTFSKWESEDHLNVYRDSEVFKSTWEKVKPLFVAKPEAFSMEELI